MGIAKAIIVCVVLFSMVASGFSGVLAFGPSATPSAQKRPILVAGPTDAAQQEIRLPLTFGDIVATEQDGYELLSVDGATGYLLRKDAPMVPMYSKMLPLPVNTKIVSVSLEQTVYASTWTDLKVIPAPQAVPMIDGTVVPGLQEGEAYRQSALYPESELMTTITTGQGDWGGIEAHLFVKVFPVRYNPVTNVVIKIERCELVVKYVPPPAESSRSTRAGPHYDILVLHPDEYGDETARYVAHKQSMGWTVKNVSLSEVYGKVYFNVSKGRDNPEKIKYFIKQAFENWTMEHVLVVGDSDKFPIRQVWVNDIDGTATPTDLYYEDLFKAGTTTFSDWNYDNDALWGESSSSNKNADQCDLDPDVAVGRFPVGTAAELRGVVNKTISYDENISKPDAYDWFKNVTLVGSDTFTASQHGETSGVPEGEYTMDTDTKWLGGFQVSKFYETKGTLNTNNIKNNVAKGAGIMAFADHGSEGGVVYGYSNGQWGMLSAGASSLTNGHKLPLSIMDACLTHKPDYSESIGEYLVLNPNGGAIGSIGATRIAYGMWGTWHIVANSGFIDTHLFQEHQNGTIMPALMLDKSKRDYQNEVGIWDYADFKTQVQYIYYGDPTVWIGGTGIQVEPANNPQTLAPGETGQFLVGLDNRGLVADDLLINISGGNFSYTLSDYSLHMKADSMIYISVGVTVDGNALAGKRENITLNVTPLSTTMPILTNLSTIVKAVRDVKFTVPQADFNAMPGDKVAVDFEVQNSGNVGETASSKITGGDGGFVVDVSSSGLAIAPFKKYSGNITLDVPGDALADKYYFELVLSTVSGATKTFVISVDVSEVDGLEAYFVNDAKTFLLDGMVEFELYVGNIGNHREKYELSLAFVEPSKWSSTIVWDLPGSVTLDAMEDTTETINLRAKNNALADDVAMTLNVKSTIPGGPSETLTLKAIVPEVSDIGITVVEKEARVKEGKSAVFKLLITSNSNFEENVDLSVDGAPADWMMMQDVAEIVVAPYSNAFVNLTFDIPTKYLAGDHQITATAKGNNSQDSVSFTATVDPSSSVALTIDKTEFKGYPGDKADLTVTVENRGNHEGLFIIIIESVTQPFQFVLPASAVTLAAWAKADVLLTVIIPESAPPKDGTLKLKARSATEGTVYANAEVKIQSLFLAMPELDIHPDQASDGYIGQSSSYTVVLVNKGNIVETVSLKENGTSGLVLQVPANVTLKPGEVKEVVVRYDVPEGMTPGQYPITLSLTSTEGTSDVVHTVTALLVPTKKANTGNVSSTLPYLFIILVLVVLVCLLAVMYAIKGRSKKGEPEIAPTVPQTSAAPTTTAPEAERPAPSPAPVVTPAPTLKPIQEPPKTIGGGAPPPQAAPSSDPPQPSAPIKPVDEDKAIDDVLNDLDK